MVYKRVKGWTSERSLSVQNFVEYTPVVGYLPIFHAIIAEVLLLVKRQAVCLQLLCSSRREGFTKQQCFQTRSIHQSNPTDSQIIFPWSTYFSHRVSLSHFFCPLIQWTYRFYVQFPFNTINKLTSVFHASVLLLIINFVITLSK